MTTSVLAPREMPASTVTRSLTASESLVLDVIRVLASITVAASHIAQHSFSTGWPNLDYLALFAVAIFFVLSGFVIRHVTVLKPVTLRHYFSDRASRIYSVALPALLVTWVADSISRRVNPAFYYKYWGDTASHPLLRIVENIIFTAQLWFRDVSPLSNLPFWSLNYEIFYYIIYGCAFYLVGGKRIVWVLLAMLVAGPRILILSPAWVAGYVAHDLYQRWNAAGKTAKYLDRILVGCLVFAVMAGVVFRFDHHVATHLHVYKDSLKSVMLSMNLGKADKALSYYCVAIFGTVVFLRLMYASRTFELSRKSRGVEAVRFIAEGTFPIYVLHFPLLVLIAATVPYNHAATWPKVVLLLFVSTIGILAGHPLNILKRKFRSWV